MSATNNQPAPLPATGSEAPAVGLPPGSTLGRYRIERFLGRGGMGEVYLVEQVELRKRYAMKVLPRELARDPRFVARFRVEARVMADLDHPHIVRVHNLGQEQGAYFLIMDYIEGPNGKPQTLEELLGERGQVSGFGVQGGGRKGERGGLDEATVKGLALQICDALAYAHSFHGEGVLHRDLKPSNILLEASGVGCQVSGGGSGTASPRHATLSPPLTVKVSDFGLAKVLGAEYLGSMIDRSVQLSMAGGLERSMGDQATQTPARSSGARALLGTYEYMSPEQKAGQEATVRSDLYALGVMLYRMLTGERPEGAYEPPSAFGVSKAWDAIVKRCLQRDAAQRYLGVAEIKREIEAIRLGRARVSRSAVGVGVIAAGVALLVGLVWFAARRNQGGPTAVQTEQQRLATVRQQEADAALKQQQEELARLRQERDLALAKQHEEEAARIADAARLKALEQRTAQGLIDKGIEGKAYDRAQAALTEYGKGYGQDESVRSRLSLVNNALEQEKALAAAAADISGEWLIYSTWTMSSVLPESSATGEGGPATTTIKQQGAELTMEVRGEPASGNAKESVFCIGSTNCHAFHGVYDIAKRSARLVTNVTTDYGTTLEYVLVLTVAEDGRSMKGNLSGLVSVEYPSKTFFSTKVNLDFRRIP